MQRYATMQRFLKSSNLHFKTLEQLGVPVVLGSIGHTKCQHALAGATRTKRLRSTERKPSNKSTRIATCPSQGAGRTLQTSYLQVRGRCLQKCRWWDMFSRHFRLSVSLSLCLSVSLSLSLLSFSPLQGAQQTLRASRAPNNFVSLAWIYHASTPVSAFL